MKLPADALQKYNVVIPKLFQIILNLPEDKQSVLLKYAEDLLKKERRAFIRKSCSIPVAYSTYERFYTNPLRSRAKLFKSIEVESGSNSKI